MKKFKFKLEPVLRVRRHEEKQQQQAYARVLQQKKSLEEERQQTLDQLHAFNERRNAGVGGGGGQRTVHMRQALAYVEQQHQQLWDLDRRINEVEKELEKERKKLIEANKKVKVMENLESKERMRFLEHVEHLEEKALNEISIQRYNWHRR